MQDDAASYSPQALLQRAIFRVRNKDHMRCCKSVLYLLMTISSSRCEERNDNSIAELEWLIPKKTIAIDSFSKDVPDAEEYVQKFLMRNKFLLFLSLTPLLFKVCYNSFLQHCLNIKNEIQDGLLWVTAVTLGLNLGFSIIANILKSIGEGDWGNVATPFVRPFIDSCIKNAGFQAAREGNAGFLFQPVIVGKFIQEVRDWGANILKEIINPGMCSTLTLVQYLLTVCLSVFENRLINKILEIFHFTLKEMVDGFANIMFQAFNNTLMHRMRGDVLTDAARAIFKKPTRFYTTVNPSVLALTMSRLPEAIKETYLGTYLPFLEQAFDFMFHILAESLCRNPMAWLYVGIIYRQALQVQQKEFAELEKKYENYVYSKKELDQIPASLVANSVLIKFGNPKEEVANFLRKKKEVNTQLLELQETINGLTAEKMDLESTTIIKLTRIAFIITGLLAQKDFRATLFQVPSCFMKILRQVEGVLTESFPMLKGPISHLLSLKIPQIELIQVMTCLVKLSIIYTYLSEKEELYYKLVTQQVFRFTAESKKIMASPEIAQCLDTIYSDPGKSRKTERHYRVSFADTQRIAIIIPPPGFVYQTKSSERLIDSAKERDVRELVLTKPLPDYETEL